MPGLRDGSVVGRSTVLIHPYLVHFTANAGWLNISATNCLLNVHWRAEDRGFKCVMHTGLRSKRIAEWHRRILELWERDME